MEAWHPLGVIGLFLGCFGLSIVSALVPWVNGEVLLLSLTAWARSPWDIVILVLLTSAGQMVGKCLLYWVGRGTVRFQSRRIHQVVTTWKERFERSPSKSLGLVFFSSAVGIPPFYVITLLAGSFRMKFGPFIGVGTCGRLVRFGTLVAIPQLALHLIR
jgi:membrane protein YqaA with SNARE-associated domain